jgi:FeS assembly ATPase SufC
MLRSAVRKVVLGLPARRDASLPRAALYMRAEIGLDRIQFAIQRSSALNAQRKTRGEAELSTPEFMKLVRETSKHLGIDQEMLRRAVNVGFSGGEKKRNEILQMAVLQPRLAVLDETDSGLDIDALKIVPEGVNRLRSPERSIVVITHYQRLLNFIVPDVVHVMAKGRVVKSGGKELAFQLEAKGYASTDNVRPLRIFLSSTSTCRFFDFKKRH